MQDHEKVQVDVLNKLIKQIEKDLIKEKYNYLWSNDAPANEYERGVLNVIRLIQFRVHCICD